MRKEIIVPPNKRISANIYSPSTFESPIPSQGTNYGNSWENSIAFISCITSLMASIFAIVISDENRYGNPISVC